ncbi:MAG: AMP-binding protein [Pseudomonadota bacterium]
MTDYPDLIAKRAALSPTKLALRDLKGERALTYRSLDAASAKCAALLQSKGIGAEDRVAILCRNRIEFFEALFACAKVGAILVPLNWRMPAAELQGILSNCQPTLIFVGEEDLPTLEQASPAAPVVKLDDNSADGYQALCETSPPIICRDFWPADQIWYLLYTSGTTGAPKAVMQTYQMAVINYTNVRQAIDLQEDDRTLNFLPLFHTAGINLYTLPMLFAGAEVSILPGFDVDETMGLLANGALDVFFGVPAVYQQISLHPAFAEIDCSRVRHWGCGGAPLQDVLVEAFAERGALVCNGYGMTETGPTAYLMHHSHVRRKIGSVGMTQMMTAARLLGGDGAPVGPNEPGELQLKGPGITPGYWGAPDATKAAFTDDGWLKTGDLASADEEGFTYIVGRSKEMYISGGENVYPAEVENMLARHPAVLEAAVVGVPDEKWGEVGRAFVQLRDDQCAGADELMRYARDNLAAYKAPKSFVFVTEFPRTAAGKIQKHLLTAGGADDAAI